MAKEKALTYEEFMEYARKHYNRGGDGCFECWDRRVFDDYVKECGAMTKSRALDLFRQYYWDCRDIELTAW